MAVFSFLHSRFKLLITMTILFSFLNLSSSKFLEMSVVQNNICQNDNQNNFAFVQSIRFLEDTTSNEMFKNHLNTEERKSYEETITTKNFLSQLIPVITQVFNPESIEYWDKLTTTVAIFLIISLFPLFFILFYYIMRAYRNCVAKKKGKDLYKISDINKKYRNITWVLFIIGAALTMTLLTIVLSKSSKINDAVDTAFGAASETIAKNDKFYDKLNEVIVRFRDENMNNIPSEAYMEEFHKLIDTWIKNTKTRTEEILEDDSTRHTIIIILYIYYWIIIILGLVIFLLKIENLQILMTIIMFLSVPALFALDGYNAKFFIYYADFCKSVNSALYQNELPVADQSLGYYYNCFTLDTKAKLYNIRYKLYENIAKLNEDDEYYQLYEKLSEEVLQSQFDCEIVADVIPKIEMDFCKDSLKNSYDIVKLMLFTLIGGLLLAIGDRRFEVLIWKKKNELESMIKNLEEEF